MFLSVSGTGRAMRSSKTGSGDRYARLTATPSLGLFVGFLARSVSGLVELLLAAERRKGEMGNVERYAPPPIPLCGIYISS